MLVPGAESQLTIESGPTADYRTGSRPTGVSSANTGTFYAAMKAADNGNRDDAEMLIRSYAGKATISLW